MKQFGPEVNLGNIPPEEVIPLETLRLGLRGDTLKQILLAGEPRPRASRVVRAAFGQGDAVAPGGDRPAVTASSHTA